MKIRKLPFDYARVEREMSALMPCAHAKRIVGHKTTSNGRPFLRLQCPECGAALSARLSKAGAAELFATGIQEGKWNDGLALYHSVEWNRLSRPIIDRMNAERRTAWWSDYQAYLNCNQWKDRASDALKRAGYVCERCKRRKAVHVHHLSYDRAGDEPPEDLQALCFECHDQAHDGRLSLDRTLDQLDVEFGIA